jgi:hypothetical protein
MSDVISRSALIEALVHCDGLGRKSCEAVIKTINELPTVEANPAVKGEWKYDWLGEYICSNCYERVAVKEVMGEPAWDWCPACGADMRGEKHD